MGLQNTSYVYSIILALLFAISAGLIGSFSLMKRMLLAGDVVSHLALPGLGIALLLGINPLLGATVTLMFGTVAIWDIQRQTGLATENVIGVVFAASLAIGACVTPKEDLVDALFGNFSPISLLSFLAGIVAVLFITLSLFRLKHGLVMTLFSEDLAIVTGVKLDAQNLHFLFLFSLTVLVGLRFMGTLLAASLIILPAAIARRFTNKMGNFFYDSSLISLACIIGGLIVTHWVFPKYGLGPITVLLASAAFMASLFSKRS